MCDTFVALPNTTKDEVTLFAKNSDREANEAQALIYCEAKDHAKDARLDATYIDIPQASHTHAAILSKPYWMWGAEMGVNEHGLAIGNEAVFSKVPAVTDRKLIGMDYVRLGLERAASADEALTIITDLLASYGQGGNCGHTNPFFYHNSFLLADRSSAWVLETIGSEWVAERVTGIRTISNCLTIRNTHDRRSDGLLELARSVGWKGGSDFDFSEVFGARVRNRLSSGLQRWRRSSELLKQSEGHLDVADVMATLRDRGESADRKLDWRPDGVMNGTICAHASYGPARRSGQTTGSQVSCLADSGDCHFFTGTASPDLSVFKPVRFGAKTSDYEEMFGPEPSGAYDEKSLWWQHELLHRAVLEDYALRRKSLERERAGMERQLVIGALEGRLDDPEDIRKAWVTAANVIDNWRFRVLRKTPKDRGSRFYQRHWQRLSEEAKLPENWNSLQLEMARR